MATEMKVVSKRTQQWAGCSLEMSDIVETELIINKFTQVERQEGVRDLINSGMAERNPIGDKRTQEVGREVGHDFAISDIMEGKAIMWTYPGGPGGGARLRRVRGR